MNHTEFDQNDTASTLPSLPTRVPPYNISEQSEAYVVTAAIPGVDRSGLEATVTGDQLSIDGRPAWTMPHDWLPLHREIPESHFQLVLTLDHRVNRDAVRIELQQGLLKVTLPKADAAKPRRIEVAA